jgi:hypothetical protein
VTGLESTSLIVVDLDASALLPPPLANSRYLSRIRLAEEVGPDEGGEGELMILTAIAAAAAAAAATHSKADRASSSGS